MFKKILAGVLSAATVLSMSMTAFAAGNAAENGVVGLSPYGTTPYTEFVNVGDIEPVEFTVTGLKEKPNTGTSYTEYEKTPLSYDQAADVQWHVTKQTVAGLSDADITVSDPIDKGSEGWVSEASIDISGVSNYGYAVIQASLNGHGLTMPTIDFVIVFNPSDGTSITAQGIECVFKVNGTEYNASVGNVGMCDVEGIAQYPNALYATKCAEGKGADCTVSDVNISNGYLSSVTINGTTYGGSNGYWEYRLYKPGDVLVDDSVTLGANVMPIYNNYKVVWSFTAY